MFYSLRSDPQGAALQSQAGRNLSGRISFVLCRRHAARIKSAYDHNMVAHMIPHALALNRCQLIFLRSWDPLRNLVDVDF